MAARRRAVPGFAPIFTNSAAFASYPGMEVLNSSSVPRVKFMVKVTNLILAGIF